MAYRYLISKTIDPIFAVGVGVGATLTRIRRDEKANEREWPETWAVFERRLRLAFGQEEKQLEQ
ncbi:hypothetical protein EJ05DRAFT_503492 [Pseudovirgaria hyperparasitica]|uniref:Uncharacterized protein n=1 Tax=Pseudovirgaria hyperparasitica TaxID=470096 RepID=A0A6A6W0T9_9PEZI|nr:uncharacterized protein EJ05DRAFT_503492 [Pseudovirgaria hyperparasitica]KAF2755187.1 hypothetical protein EJ05DRAFT_503492 [Pseudovirgaria hyperparasitica]